MSERPASSCWTARPAARASAARAKASTPRSSWATKRSVTGRARGPLAGRQQHPLEAGGPAHAGRRRAAEQLDEAVVAPAARHAGLRAQRVGGELEDRARVVVDAAHERAVELPVDPGHAQARADLVEVLAILGAERVQQQRRVAHDLLGAGVLGVEGAQRVEVDAVAHVGAEAVGVLAQVGREALAVLGARVEAAERAQAQAQPLDAELAEQRVQQDDRLGVDGGVVGADRLGAQLPELAEAPGLRLLLAVVAAQVPELHRLGQLVHAVLEVGAAHRRGALGAQRQRAAAGVLEGVHLLLDDVGRLPHAAGEELRGLEGRRLDAPVARGLEDRARGSLEVRPRGGLLGQHVVRAARRLGPLATSAPQLARPAPGAPILPARSHRPASACRNGLVARSRPSVVSPM